jgi:hypothetical protein
LVDWFLIIWELTISWLSGFMKVKLSKTSHDIAKKKERGTENTIWANYNDFLFCRALESWLIRGIIPFYGLNLGS